MPSLTSMFGPQPRITIPPELSSLPALLDHLGCSMAELKKIRWFSRRMYHSFTISKRSGKKRVISAPDRRLKMLQSKIALLLLKLYRPRSGVHGFVRDRSIKTNASAHQRSRYVLNIDLADFFSTITRSRILGLLEALGLNSDVAKAISWICLYQGALPQGAPSSPILSNMICFRLDKQLQAYAKATRCIYTRYADDITLSGFQPPVGLFEGQLPSVGRVPKELLAKTLVSILDGNGFTLNEEKTHYADRHARRSVTGIRINELLNVDRRYIRNVRAALYRVEKIGKVAAQAELATKFGKGSELGSHLQGRLSFIAYIKGRADPTFRTLASRFNASFPDLALSIPPTPEEMRNRAIWVVEHDGNKGEQGTCFFMKFVGLVTACHCVGAQNEVMVYHPGKPSNTFKVKVLHRDARRDLALLDLSKIPSANYFELERTLGFTTGEPVVAAGYPGFGPGDNINLRSGEVASFFRKSLVDYVEVTQKLLQGASGGPLLDSQGRVAGVIHKGGPLIERDHAVHVNMVFQWLGEITQPAE